MPVTRGLLLGMGLKEFSVHPNALLEVKQVITESRVSETRQLTQTGHAGDQVDHAQRIARRDESELRVAAKNMTVTKSAI